MNQTKEATGQPEAADIQTLGQLRSRLMPLVRQLEALKNQLANPHNTVGWPMIQRNIVTLSSLINSINALIYDDPKVTARLAALHAYPVTPFQTAGHAMANLPPTILRVHPEPAEDKWTADRLSRAQPFAHVPEQWGIEPRRLPGKDADAEAPEDEDQDVDVTAASRLKRGEGTLNEDQLGDLWGLASSVVIEEMENVGEGVGGEKDGEDEGGDDDDDDETHPASSAEDVVMGGSDAAQAMEKRVLLPMAVVHKFMMTGEVEVA